MNLMLVQQEQPHHLWDHLAQIELAQSSCGCNSPFFLHSFAPFAHLSILHTYLCPFVILDLTLKALNTKNSMSTTIAYEKNYRN
jgi:hypothetical protein